MPNHATEDQHQEGNEVVKVQLGYELRGCPEPQSAEIEEDDIPIILIPEGASRIQGSLEVSYHPRRNTWALRVNDGTLLIEPGGANTIHIKSDRRGL